MKTILLFLLCLLPFQLFPKAKKEGSELRVLSYNVWYGFTKQPERKKKWLEYVSSLKPDVVSLQELNSYTEEKLAEDARAWGHPHSVLLKTKGFPTGITSVFRSRKSHVLWRVSPWFAFVQNGWDSGLCNSSSSRHWQIRHREVDLLTRELAKRNPSEKILLAVTSTPFHRETANNIKKRRHDSFFRRLDKRWKSNRNLREDQLDYTHLEKIEKAGFIDLVAGKRTGFLGTFPTKTVREKTTDLPAGSIISLPTDLSLPLASPRSAW